MSKSRRVYKEMNFSQSRMFNTLNLPDQLLIIDYSILIPKTASAGFLVMFDQLLITDYSSLPS